jgi:hypothetical protein
MTTAIAPMYQWHIMSWTKIERQVFQRQTRLYRAAKREVIERGQAVLAEQWRGRDGH